MNVGGGSQLGHTEKDVCVEVPVGNFAGNFVGAFCIIMANFTPCIGATLMKIKQELFLPQKAFEKPLQDCRPYSKFSQLVSASTWTTNNRPRSGERQLDQYN